MDVAVSYKGMIALFLAGEKTVDRFTRCFNGSWLNSLGIVYNISGHHNNARDSGKLRSCATAPSPTFSNNELCV